jgi:outer membrane protein TolC
MEKSFAEMKMAEAMRNLRDRQSELKIAWEELFRLTGIRDSVSLDSLKSGLVPPSESAALNNSPWLQLAEEKSDLAREELKLSRRQQLPGFYAAFMNQGERDSPMQNRFGFGISIPLWFWQVNANVKAASLREKQTELEYEWISRSIASELQSALLRLLACRERVSGMLTSDIPLIESISADATRTFEAGEISMIEYLRILSDTQAVMDDYVIALHEHEQAQNQINFITSIP